MLKMRLCRQDAALPFVLQNRKIPKPVDNRAFDRHNNEDKKACNILCFPQSYIQGQAMKNIFSETRTPIGKTALSEAAVHTVLIVAYGRCWACRQSCGIYTRSISAMSFRKCPFGSFSARSLRCKAARRAEPL